LVFFLYQTKTLKSIGQIINISNFLPEINQKLDNLRDVDIYIKQTTKEIEKIRRTNSTIAKDRSLDQIKPLTHTDSKEIEPAVYLDKGAGTGVTVDPQEILVITAAKNIKTRTNISLKHRNC
jgi:hypothetical protein